jgi:hypothetical protein
MWSTRWVPEAGIQIAVARDVTDYNLSRVRAETLLENPAGPVWRLFGSPPRLVPTGLSAVPLSPQDHAVLLALASASDGAHRQVIVEALGEDYLQYDRRRLDTQMRWLRRKVREAAGLELPVLTARGVGYRFFERVKVIP